MRGEVSIVRFLLVLLTVSSLSFAQKNRVVTRVFGEEIQCILPKNKPLRLRVKIENKWRPLNYLGFSKKQIKKARKRCERAFRRNGTFPTPTITPPAINTPTETPLPKPTEIVTPLTPPVITNRFSDFLCESEPCPRIFRVSESGATAVNIIGHGLDQVSGVRVWRFNGGLLDPKNAEIAERDDSTMIINIPVEDRVYAFELLRDSGDRLKAFLINSPKIFFTDSENLARDGIVRIVGRNFIAAGLAPKVSLENLGVSTKLQVVEYDNYFVKAKVPLSAPLGSGFRLKVDIGSEISALTEPVYSISLPDPNNFNLGVPWLSSFHFGSNVYNVKTDVRLTKKAVGDGVVDDIEAIQEAINKAGLAGGGTVYLPPGTYKIDTTNTSLEISRSRVVLVGGSPEQTKITYGHSGISAKAPILFTEHTEMMGLINLSIDNKSPDYLRQSVSGPLTPTIAHNTKNFKHIVLKNVHVNAGFGEAIRFYAVDGLLIESVLVKSSSLLSTPIYFSGNKRLVFENNRVEFVDGRVELLRGDNAIINNNEFIRDGAFIDQVGESGGIQISYSHDVLVRNNLIEIVNLSNTPVRFGDHEMILVQDVSGVDEFAYGTVSSADDNSLTDAEANWASYVFTVPNKRTPVIAITDGKGMGQWREIDSWTTNSLTIKEPWDVVPDSTSVYAITRWNAVRAQVVGNVVRRGAACINYYDGGLDSVIDENHCIDAGPIILYGRDLGTTGNPHRRLLMWDTVAQDNLIENRLGVSHAGLRLELQMFTSRLLHGSTMVNSIIKGNHIVAGVPNIKYPRLFHEEKLFVAVGGGGAAYTGSYNKGILGTILEDNTFENIVGDSTVITQGVSRILNKQSQ